MRRDRLAAVADDDRDEPAAHAATVAGDTVAAPAAPRWQLVNGRAVERP